MRAPGAFAVILPMLGILASACALIPPGVEPLRGPQIEDGVARMAATALGSGQFETARRLYSRLLDVHPESVAARMGLGDVALKAGDPAAAARWYRSALTQARTRELRHGALLAHGRAALAASQIEAANASFTRLTDPREHASQERIAWGHNGIGLTLLLRGDLQGAVAAMERAVMLVPGEPRFQGNLDRALALLDGYSAEKPAAPAAAPPAAAPPAAPDPPPTGAARVRTDLGESLSPTPDAEAETTIDATDESVAAADPQPVSGIEAEESAEPPAKATSATAAETGRQPSVEPSEPRFHVVKDDGGCFVQVGTYSNAANAQAAMDRIQPVIGLPIVIQAASAASVAPLHRVRIGPIPSDADLRALTVDLESHPGTFGQVRGSCTPFLPTAYWLVREDGERFLQAGAFGERSKAEGLAAEIRMLTDRAVQVTEAADNRAPLYRVRIGPLAADDTGSDLPVRMQEQ